MILKTGISQRFCKYNDDKIVVLSTPHKSIFDQAARDPKSCDAVVLEISEEQKTKERKILDQFWDQYIPDNPEYTFSAWYHRNLTNIANQHYQMGTPPESIEPIVSDIASNHCGLKYIPKCEVEITPFWRQDPDKKPHRTHPYAVTNCVFYALGTQILGEKIIQVAQGDRLHLQPHCPHQPLELNGDNDEIRQQDALQKRLTIAAFYDPNQFLDY